MTNIDRRQFLYALGIGALASSSFAQDIVTESAQDLAKKVAQYTLEWKSIQKGLLASRRYIGSVEYIDKETGEDVSDKLPWKSGSDPSVPFSFGSLDPADIPASVATYYYDEATLNIRMNNESLNAKAKIYKDASGKRDYSNPRNLLEISCSDTGGLAHFVDRGLKGATTTTGNADQESYITCLLRISRAYNQ